MLLWRLRVLQMLMAKALAETIGTFAMVFAGVGSIHLTERYPQIPGILVPVVWGAVIALMILAWGSTSGAHFNPAVSLAMTVAKRSPAALLPLYWASQAFGALCAVVILEGLKKL